MRLGWLCRCWYCPRIGVLQQTFLSEHAHPPLHAHRITRVTGGTARCFWLNKFIVTSSWWCLCVTSLKSETRLRDGDYALTLQLWVSVLFRRWISDKMHARMVPTPRTGFLHGCGCVAPRWLRNGFLQPRDWLSMEWRDRTGLSVLFSLVLIPIASRSTAIHTHEPFTS